MSAHVSSLFPQGNEASAPETLVTPRSFPKVREPAPQRRPVRPTAPSPRRGAALRSVLAGLGACAGLVACTLTSDDFEPLQVDRTEVLPDAGAPVEDPGCGPGLSCCETRPCPPDEVCSAGSCVALGASTDAGRCVGTDCSSAGPLPLVPGCDDGAKNGDETGVDCGGSCSRTCLAGSGCNTDADCGNVLFRGPGTSLCAAISCSDGIRNGDEVLADCGGGTCPGCPDATACSTGLDCASGVCGAAGTCSAPSCDDGVQNQGETGVDCGSDCPESCATGAGCSANADCDSAVCGPQGCAAGLANCCQAPSCDDGVQNGGEPITDCGNLACGLCPLGSPCAVDAQCDSNLCTAGSCTDPGSCNDFVRNGTETGVDCGGGVCNRCPDLQGCSQPSDCNNNNCDARGICISCGDGVIDGTESGIDCGGADPFCRRCNPGEVCRSNTDCVNQFCLGGFCT